MKKTYRYKIKLKNGKLEPWSTSFKSLKAAKEWYNTMGLWWINERGKNLVLVEIQNEENEDD